MCLCFAFLGAFLLLLIKHLPYRHWLREDNRYTVTKFCTRSKTFQCKLPRNDGDVGSYWRTSTSTRTRFDQEKYRKKTEGTNRKLAIRRYA